MITEKTTLTELAGLVSAALEQQGIIATLSGGAAISIYTDNRYLIRSPVSVREFRKPNNMYLSTYEFYAILHS